MENNTKNLWTTKFKEMTPEEKKKAEKVYNYASSLLSYYSEFNMAKKSSNFIKKGWYKNMFFLRRTPEDIINYVGVSHNDLLKAAKEYQDNNGADTEFTKDFEQRIQELKQKMKNNPNKIKLIWKILIAAIMLFLAFIFFSPSNETEIPVYNGIKTKIIGYRLEIKANKELTEQDILDMYLNNISKKIDKYNIVTVLEPTGKGYTITGSGWVRYGYINEDGFPVKKEKEFDILRDEQGNYGIYYPKKSQPTPTVSESTDLSPEDKAKRTEYIKQLRALYTELQEMKNNPEFLTKVYAWEGSKNWQSKVEAVQNTYENGFHAYNNNINVLAGDLWQLGLAYGFYHRHNDEQKLKYIKYTESQFNEFMELTKSIN